MSPSDIVFLEVDTEDEARVRERFPEATVSSGALEEAQLLETAQPAAVLSTFIHTKFPRSVIEQLPNLQLLCTRSVGYNHIDLAACAERGITVCHVPDYGSHVIAEHVFALLLSTLRHIPEADERVEQGQYNYHGLRGMALRGKTLGVVGTGRIGRRVVQIAHGFGMGILAVDKCRVVELEDLLGIRYVSLDDLLQGSDIITLHAPATDETHHMLDAEAFAQMKDGVVVVNTARGELIDSAALLDALKSGKVAYALLDVLENEKVLGSSEELIAHPNVVTTPHIAFYAEESMRNMFEDCFESIDQFRAGREPDHIVHEWKEVCDLPGIKKG